MWLPSGDHSPDNNADASQRGTASSAPNNDEARCPEQGFLTSSHRRGHWFDPSIAHSRTAWSEALCELAPVRFGGGVCVLHGPAPIAVSSGDVVRHRFSSGGGSSMHCIVMAITQVRHDTAGRAYYRRERAARKSHKEALRCLKRRLSEWSTASCCMMRRRRAREDIRGRLCSPARPARPRRPTLRTSYFPDPPRLSPRPRGSSGIDRVVAPVKVTG
jgi:hypothetical protein